MDNEGLTPLESAYLEAQVFTAELKQLSRSQSTRRRRTSPVVADSYSVPSDDEDASSAYDSVDMQAKSNATAEQTLLLEEFVEHRLALDEIGAKFGTELNLEEPGVSKGLTEEQAEDHLRKFGLNQLQARKSLPVWARFLKQFVGFFPILLESAGILALIGWGLEGALEAHNQDNLYLAIILFLEVIATAIFSFIQEEKASKAASGFADMAPPMVQPLLTPQATVIRDGQKRRIPASHLAVGDLVKFKQGDKVPADLLVIEARELRVDNSSITGESEPQARSPRCTSELFLETENLVFYTTGVHVGSGLGVAIRTGHRTYIGHIADVVAATKPEATPLRREITRFLKIVTAVSVVIGLAFLGMGFGLRLTWVGTPLLTV